MLKIYEGKRVRASFFLNFLLGFFLVSGLRAQTIVSVAGPSCSGKSTLTKSLYEKFQGTKEDWVILDLDELLEEKYKSEKNLSREEVDAQALVYLQNKAHEFLLAGKNIIIDTNVWSDDFLGTFDKIEDNLKCFCVLVYAPLSVLLERDALRNKRLQRSEKRACWAKQYVEKTFGEFYSADGMAKFTYDFLVDSVLEFVDKSAGNIFDSIEKSMEFDMCKDKEKNTIMFYDEHAHDWQSKYEKVSKPRSFWQEEVNDFFKMLSENLGKSIIEIGSGKGVEAQKFIGLGCDYTGIDPSKGLLERAQTRNPDGEFLNMSVYELSSLKRKFDGFWSAAVLLHVSHERINEALRAINSVLVSGGVGFISLAHGEGECVGKDGRWFFYYSKEEFYELLKNNGFRVEKYYTKPSKSNHAWGEWGVFFVRKIAEHG